MSHLHIHTKLGLGQGFRVSGFRPVLAFSLLTPCMKLHEIPHAVAEYGLRPRRRPRPL
jgi:hypothetical protein